MRFIYFITSIFISLLSWLWLYPSLAQATGLSSTYQPSLQVTIDQAGVNNTVVLRAHHAYQRKHHTTIYPCNNGGCAFRANHHKYESDWTYSIAQFKNKLPDSAKTDKQKQKFYHDNATKLKLYVDVSAPIKSIDFSKQTQIIDYQLRIVSKDKTATLEKTDRGEYNPLQQTTISLFGFSGLPLRLIGAFLAIVITYVGFRYIPVSVHHH